MREREHEPDCKATVANLVQEALASGARLLNGYQSNFMLIQYGLFVPPGGLAKSEAEAVDIAPRHAGDRGSKLVLKAVGAGIHHKTEAGLLVLGVEGAEAVADVYRTLQQRVVGAFDGVLVEQLVESSREFMVGMRRDPVYGPVVAFGVGGLQAKPLEDVALALAPVGYQEALDMLDGIKAQELLGPYGGFPAVERATLARLIQTFGEIAMDHPNIVEIDGNPLLVAEDRLVVGDSLVVLSDEPAPTPERPAALPGLGALLEALPGGVGRSFARVPA